MFASIDSSPKLPHQRIVVQGFRLLVTWQEHSNHWNELRSLNATLKECQWQKQEAFWHILRLTVTCTGLIFISLLIQPATENADYGSSMVCDRFCFTSSVATRLVF
eukprot:Gb_04345 [translate_table: standard]